MPDDQPVPDVDGWPTMLLRCTVIITITTRFPRAPHMWILVEAAISLTTRSVLPRCASCRAERDHIRPQACNRWIAGSAMSR